MAMQAQLEGCGFIIVFTFEGYFCGLAGIISTALSPMDLVLEAPTFS